MKRTFIALGITVAAVAAATHVQIVAQSSCDNLL